MDGGDRPRRYDHLSRRQRRLSLCYHSRVLRTRTHDWLRIDGASVAIYVFLTLFFCWPLFAVPDGLGILDWDVHLFYYGSVIKSVVEYGQLPFWNPWYCGGNVLWQNPQVPLLSPVFALVPFMSLPLAMKINIALHYMVGLLGMHLLLTRALGLRSTAAVIYLASLVVFSGAMAMHVAAGHSVFLPCLYLPLQLYCCIRAVREGHIRHIAGAAALLALMIFNGALHVLSMSVGGLGILALGLAIGCRDWRPMAVTLLIGVLGMAYAAPKLLPVTLWVSSERFVDARNTLEHPDAMSFEMLARTYLDPFQTRRLRFDGQRSDWYEYGNYIGLLGAVLIGTGMIVAIVARRANDRALGAGLAITSWLLLLLSAGEFGRWAPASLAHYVPLFSNFRIPSRYTIVAVLYGTAAAAWVLREVGLNAATSSSLRVFIALMCMLGTTDLVVQNRRVLQGIFATAPFEHAFTPMGGPKSLTTDVRVDPYRSDSPTFRALMSNRSVYNCYEPLQTKRVASPDDPLITVNGSATVSDVTFSPNRIEFSAIGGTVMSEVSLNQNLVEGWWSTIGPLVPSLERGRPAARLGPGQRGRFAFTFRPPGLRVGVGLMILAVVATAVAWRRSLLNLSVRA